MTEQRKFYNNTLIRSTVVRGSWIAYLIPFTEGKLNSFILRRNKGAGRAREYKWCKTQKALEKAVEQKKNNRSYHIWVSWQWFCPPHIPLSWEHSPSKHQGSAHPGRYIVVWWSWKCTVHLFPKFVLNYDNPTHYAPPPICVASYKADYEYKPRTGLVKAIPRWGVALLSL